MRGCRKEAVEACLEKRFLFFRALAQATKKGTGCFIVVLWNSHATVNSAPAELEGTICYFIVVCVSWRYSNTVLARNVCHGELLAYRSNYVALQAVHSTSISMAFVFKFHFEQLNCLFTVLLVLL